MNITPINLDNSTHRAALTTLMNLYASEPMGGGKPLPDAVLAQLPQRLRDWPGYCGFLAWQDDEAVGLLNAFTGFSTFAAQPLLNVHDLVVRPDLRGRGIARALLAAAEDAARAAGCCKLTLEVLSSNTAAWRSYSACGFAPYQLDPAAGQALLMQKWLHPDTTST